MREMIGRLKTALDASWRFRWHGLAVAWLVALVGVAAVFKLPNQYEADARIYVDTQSILKPLMSGLAVQPNIDQQVIMLSRTLVSRPNIEKLVRMADLDLGSDSPSIQEKQVEALMKDLEIKSTGRDNLYTLAYRNQDPARAKRVIQSLVSIFVESSLGASRKDTEAAKVFINEQIKAYEDKLEAAEARLKEFRLRNIDLQMGDGRSSASRLAELSAQLEQAKLDLREAEMARDSARQQLNAEKSAAGNSTTQSLLQESALSVATPEIDARIETQRKNLDSLLQRFTERHPDVINARKLIKELEDQKRKEVAELRKSIVAAPSTSMNMGSNSLAVQELNRVLAASEVQAASLRARVAEYTARYKQALNTLKTSPQIEAEAAQLDRDYAINKKNYEDLVARRQSAAMSGDLESASGVADFRLIDPPRVSGKPVSPNRMLMLPFVLVAAIAAGLFTAFAAGELRPVFHSGSELHAKFGLPIIGVLSVTLSEEDRAHIRTDKLRFIVATSVLFGAFAAVLIATAVVATR